MDFPSDLHTHSTESDGTQTPTVVVDEECRAGMRAMALTDHESATGWPEASARARQRGIGFVPGVELSTLLHGRSLHMLGYLIDPSAPRLVASMARVRSSREGRAERMVARLSPRYGITMEDVFAQVHHGATIGRPHIADALVARHVVADRTEAFRTILSPGGPYYVPAEAPSPLDAVRMVVEAGGVPVLAHPGRAVHAGWLPDDMIRELAAEGLAGLEVDHRENPPEVRGRLSSLAEELDLIPTGSSDYHGAGKPNRVGENTTSPRSLARIVARGRGTRAEGIPDEVLALAIST